MKQMIFLLIFLYGITGCREDEGAQSGIQFANFGEDFQIGADEKVIITGNSSGEVTDSLLVEVITMEDNRCPDGATCIRAGEVQLKIAVSDRQKTESIPTCIGFDCGSINEEFRNPNSQTEIDTTSFILDSRSYELIFKDAIPYPKASGDKSELSNGAKKAVLKIIR